MRLTQIGARTGVILLALLIALIIISLFSTSPDRLGPFGITIWFLAVLTAISVSITIGLYWHRRITNKGNDITNIQSMSIRQGVLLGILITSLLALNSLRQLSLRDVVLLMLLLVLVEFYMRRGS